MAQHKITLIPGDGIGPEIAEAARGVIEATGIDIQWEIVQAGAGVIGEYGTPLPEHVLESIKRNRVALKGPLTTPIGTGFRSINVALRQELNLYANIRPARSLPGISSRYEHVNLIVVRENTEDLYAGIEHRVGKNAAESIKIITREASERVARHAFEMAKRENRKKVTVVHKANIMKFTDGLFLECAREVSKDYPEIEFDEMIVDAMCMKLVQTPENYDVLLTPNLYGDIISDLCAGLVGGLGVAPGANVGFDAAVFEPVHGSAPKHAGFNRVNPLAIILSGIMMLKHIGENDAAERITKAVEEVLVEAAHLTYDLHGSASTSEMADAIINKMK
ncbi:MAG TPA: NAD-dependent isocitrate dehydrogenase [Desulfotomaculum sp.]|nr:MAG: Isocitrate dehydrogenase, NAD-dependent [Desulfotomaculum sp. 46_80]HAG10396.1 NAD-dependent isocitrate dehydrogenase [Desulfotomaculum sp.]HBY04185.1 NAD-dependent isocitrate dehydrogenase [Desulfotomaculum sp.]